MTTMQALVARAVGEPVDVRGVGDPARFHSRMP